MPRAISCGGAGLETGTTAAQFGVLRAISALLAGKWAASGPASQDGENESHLKPKRMEGDQAPTMVARSYEHRIQGQADVQRSFALNSDEPL